MFHQDFQVAQGVLSIDTSHAVQETQMLLLQQYFTKTTLPDNCFGPADRLQPSAPHANLVAIMMFPGDGPLPPDPK